jgi:hypothetical protein
VTGTEEHDRKVQKKDTKVTKKKTNKSTQVERSYVRQDMHCTYNVALRRVRATIVVVEKQ